MSLLMGNTIRIWTKPPENHLPFPCKLEEHPMQLNQHCPQAESVGQEKVEDGQMEVQVAVEGRQSSREDEEDDVGESSIETPQFHPSFSQRIDQGSIRIENPPEYTSSPHGKEQTFSFSFKNRSQKQSLDESLKKKSSEISDSGEEYDAKDVFFSGLKQITEVSESSSALGLSVQTSVDPSKAVEPSTTLEVESLSTPLALPPTSWIHTEYGYGRKRRRVPPMRFWLGQGKRLYKNRVVLTRRVESKR